METKSFKILSIDGGGIRGIYPAHILKRIEETFHINLLEHFDMIAGTSTGSIIAAGIASGLSADEIQKMYVSLGKTIFAKKKKLFFKSIRNFLEPLLKSSYNSAPLEMALNDVFSTKTLGEITKPLIIPSTDIGNGNVHVLKSKYSSSFIRDEKVLIKDAVLASCSAPTFFNPHNVSPYLLADGGLWANNPSLAATLDAKYRLKIDMSRVRVLSLGTGHSKIAYGTNLKKNWGFATGWKNKDFISFLLSLQSQSATNYLNLILEPGQVTRIDFESDSPLSMDDPSTMNNIISRADKDFTYLSGMIKRFFEQA